MNQQSFRYFRYDPTMPFDITITREFCAGHQLRLPDGALEPLHGHNWCVRVTASANHLDAMGCVMDFHDLEAQLDGILGPLNNRHLNELPPFNHDLNPSAENVAFHIGRSLRFPEGVQLRQVTITEAPGCQATWRP